MLIHKCFKIRLTFSGENFTLKMFQYFYSIKDISIGGRCRCNGHADLCDITDPYDAYKLLCRCQHNTCGAQCEKCCPGFVQKAWRPATSSVPFACERKDITFKLYFTCTHYYFMFSVYCLIRFSMQLSRAQWRMLLR